MSRPLDARKVVAKGIDTLDAVVREPDNVARAIGSSVGVATPVVAVSATSAMTGATGGAAIMQTLAGAGVIVGGGALTGIVVVGVGSVVVGWAAMRGVKYLRRRMQSERPIDDEQTP
jgi:hypothetical protein